MISQLRRDFAMTCKTRGGRDLGRVRLSGRSGVAVHAVQVLVNTMREQIGLYRDRFALRIRQARGGSVACKAVVRRPENARACEEDND